MISVIVPVYNEEKTLAKVVRKLEKLKLPISKEIIIINDGSKDKTREILKDLSKKFKKLKVIDYTLNRGKGFAIRKGIEKSKGEIILIQYADLEYDLENIKLLLKEILEKNEKVVYGSRFMKKNNRGKIAFYLGNKFLSMMTSALYLQRVTDMETCYKMFRREVIENISLKSDRFEIEPEITAKIIREGYKIKEVPINYSPRSNKEGKKIKAKDGIIALWTLLKLRVCN